jgi:hypothetical protein
VGVLATHSPFLGTANATPELRLELRGRRAPTTVSVGAMSSASRLDELTRVEMKLRNESVSRHAMGPLHFKRRHVRIAVQSCKARELQFMQRRLSHALSTARTLLGDSP